MKWLALSLLSYTAVLFTVYVPWKEVAIRTRWSRFVPNSHAATMIAGVVGSTISPYLFFWQASEEVEEMGIHGQATPLLQDTSLASSELARIKQDTWNGMFHSEVAAYFIILATAVTLHLASITEITTAPS